jgi:26S proteasome regulatory subunit N3
MPERRSLRSNNKPDANGDKARSNAQKDTAAPTTRAAAAKQAKSAPAKKGAKGASNKDSGENEHLNGNPVENGVNGSEDVEMGEDTAGAPPSSHNTSKDRKGNEKMTVVVPPTKGSKSSGKAGQDKEEDVTMEGAEDGDAEKTEPEVDPTTKAIQGTHDHPSDLGEAKD